MNRTKPPVSSAIPDAINCSTDKGYTMIPNRILKDPNLSGTAKAIICLLLTNSIGWKSHLEIMKKMMKEKEFALKAGLKELEEHQYLSRVRYRDKETKQLCGIIWIYTDEPGKFKPSKYESVLTKNNLELAPEVKPTSGKASGGKPTLGFFKEEKQAEEKTEENEEKESNKEKEVKEVRKEEEKKEEKKEKRSKEKFFPPAIEEVKQYCIERKNKVDPELWYDFYESKGWMIGKNKMKDWKAAVRTWERHEINSFTPLKPNNKPAKKYIDDYGDRYYWDDHRGGYYNHEGKYYIP